MFIGPHNDCFLNSDVAYLPHNDCFINCDVAYPAKEDYPTEEFNNVISDTTDSPRQPSPLRKSKPLKFGFVNACGLLSKTSCVEFIDKINEFDIVGIVETKLQCDDVELPDTTTICDYTLYHKFRKSKSHRRSGGLCLAVRTQLSHLVTPVDVESEHALLCKIESNSEKENIILGVVYIPPENSAYSDSNSFYNLERDLADVKERYNDCAICLVGDFNGHIKNAPEYFTDNFFDEDEDLTDIDVITEQTLSIHNIQTSRITEDEHPVNTWGRKLIEFCKNSELLIVNGRKGPASSKTAPKSTSSARPRAFQRRPRPVSFLLKTWTAPSPSPHCRQASSTWATPAT